MLYLILTILVGCLISVVYKYTGRKNINSDHVTLVNYVVAFTFSVATALFSGNWKDLYRIQEGNLATIFQEVSVGNTMLYVLVGGCFFGLVYVSGFIAAKNSILVNGAGVTTFFQKISFVLIVVLSAVAWKEIPSALQWVGVALAVIAVIAFAGNFRESNVTKPALLLFLIFNGFLTELNSKLFSVYGIAAYKPQLLMVIYSVALLVCVIYVIRLHRKAGVAFHLTMAEIICGMLVGLANRSSVSLQLTCLEKMSAAIVFPTLAAANLLTTFLIETFVFRERANKRQWIAIGIATVSMVFINLTF